MFYNMLIKQQDQERVQVLYYLKSTNNSILVKENKKDQKTWMLQVGCSFEHGAIIPSSNEKCLLDTRQNKKKKRLATKSIFLQSCTAKKVNSIRDVWLGKLIMDIIKEIINWTTLDMQRGSASISRHSGVRILCPQKIGHSSRRKTKRK